MVTFRLVPTVVSFPVSSIFTHLYSSKPDSAVIKASGSFRHISGSGLGRLTIGFLLTTKSNCFTSWHSLFFSIRA